MAGKRWFCANASLCTPAPSPWPGSLLAPRDSNAMDPGLSPSHFLRQAGMGSWARHFSLSLSFYICVRG